MFDIGMSEMVLLAIIGLIVIGPKQLPEVAAKAARMLNEFKRMTSDFTNEFTKTRDSATDFITQTRNEINSALENTFSDQPELSGMDEAKADAIHTELNHDEFAADHAEVAAREKQMSFAIDEDDSHGSDSHGHGITASDTHASHTERKDPGQNG